MEFWQGSLIKNVVVLAVLLMASEMLRERISGLRRLGIPPSIVAGCLGLLLGDQLLGLVSLDSELLKSGVYHALAVVFIAVGLQATPGAAQRPAGVRPMAFAITTMVALQTFAGLGVVLLLGFLRGSHVHPGIGLMLPLGFEQGPGPALSMGRAWEQTGLAQGADIGLIMAAIGFGWSTLVGVPLVAWGRSRGLVAKRLAGQSEDTADLSAEAVALGGLEPLTLVCVRIGCVYAMTWAVCHLLATRVFASMPDLAALVWGFHFMIGAVLAMVWRTLLPPDPLRRTLDNGLLRRISGLSVDIATCAALAAIELSALKASWLPILLVTTVGGLVTLLATVWLSTRAFKEAPFEHCVIWFGMSTGTLPTGLALLRMIDPDMTSPAPVSVVLGTAAATLGVAPILLLIHPIPIMGWGDAYPGAGLVALAASGFYLLCAIGLWWRFGGLKLRSPLANSRLDT